MKLINNLATFESGKAGNQAIIFIHGFPFDHRMWVNQTTALEDNYHCIAYDIRGLGQSSPGDGQFTMEMFADDLFAITEKLKLNRPVICGLSMGGYIALRAIEKDQSKFRGIILCDTKAEADDNEGKLKRAAVVKRINEEGVKPYIADFLPTCFSDISMTEMPDVYEVILQRSLGLSAAGIKGCLIAMAGRTDTSQFLSKIEIPALVLCGSNDKFVTPDAMRKMAEKIKNAEFGVAPRAGHISPIENPEFVNDMIKGFLSRLG